MSAPVLNTPGESFVSLHPELPSQALAGYGLNQRTSADQAWLPTSLVLTPPLYVLHFDLCHDSLT
jgi:hypothetical protein